MNGDPHPKSALLRPMAAFVLEHGLGRASLRPLAEAAGTSDRMLVYHFGTKAALIGAVLEVLAADLAGALDRALPAGAPMAPEALLRALLDRLGREPLRAYMAVWLEVSAKASRGDRACREVGGAIASGFLPWIEARLPEADRPRAPLLLVLIEGAVLLREVGREAVVEDALGALAAAAG